MKITIHVWAVRDTLNNIHVELIQETSVARKDRHLESEAHHLEAWCQDHGLEFCHTEQEIEIKTGFEA
jgi:hypothetical protein